MEHFHLFDRVRQSAGSARQRVSDDSDRHRSAANPHLGSVRWCRSQRLGTAPRPLCLVRARGRCKIGIGRGDDSLRLVPQRLQQQLSHATLYRAVSRRAAVPARSRYPASRGPCTRSRTRTTCTSHKWCDVAAAGGVLTTDGSLSQSESGPGDRAPCTVSYTHLTLPTILRV